MRTNKKVMEIINLTKEYKFFTLKSINFEIKKGSITGFIGINGSGKTTTIKSIAGLTIPDSGEIHFWGEKITPKNESNIRNRLGFLLDGDYYYPELTLMQMKNIISYAYSNWDEKIFDESISRFKLQPKQKIKDLSKGMKIKYLLALALSHDAEMLILDEPTSGLDPLMREDFIKILKDLAERGVTVFFSSHITSDLDKIADSIVLIHEGKILFQGEITEFKNSNDELDIERIMLNYIRNSVNVK